MAILHLNLHHLNNNYIHAKPSLSIWNPKTPPPLLSTTTDFHSKKSKSQFQSHGIRFRSSKFPHRSFTNRSLPHENNTYKKTKKKKNVEFLDKFQNFVAYINSVFPGGRWWNLCDSKQPNSSDANSITVSIALRRMWELLGNDQWIIFLAFASLIVAAASEITIPGILAASIFSAENGDAMAFSRNAHLLLILCFTSGISSGLRSGCFAIANMILIKRLRETLYSALIFQDITFFDTEEVGTLTSRLGADCQQLSHVIGTNLNLIVRNTFQGTGALINLLSLSWPLALSSLVICSALATLFLFYGRYQKMASKLTQDFTACANEAAEETLSLIRTVQVYGAETKELGRYKHWLEKLAFISVRESLAYGFWNMSFNTLYRSTQVLVVLLGGVSILTGHLSTEQLTKYILYCEWLMYATWRVADNLISLLQAIGASEKVFQLIQLSPSDQFLPKGMKLQRLMEQFQFVDVSFHYPSRQTVPILEHLHLSVKANEVVALVGRSGSGKTTIVNLLLRLYEPTNGQIYIDGFPLRELDTRWLKENIGFVGQEPQLFHMDVRSNITYGCHGDIKQEDIEWAAKMAYAHDFISSLPDGYETLIDDDLLSGGQKQRIAIARAILRNPAILILDEATSALDSESEHFVKEILHTFRNEYKAKRTVIVIAHRLSTIKTADRIIVMDGGQIVEMGNHMELLLKDGLYTRLIKAQADFLNQ